MIFEVEDEPLSLDAVRDSAPVPAAYLQQLALFHQFESAKPVEMRERYFTNKLLHGILRLYLRSDDVLKMNYRLLAVFALFAGKMYERVCVFDLPANMNPILTLK